MHELAITQGIIDIAVPETEKHGAKKIMSIKIKIGEFSGVVPQCIQEYFNIVSRGTIAENAKLVIERIPVTIRCHSCGFEGEMNREKIKFKCPACGSAEIRMLSGKEYYVDSLEVE